MNESRAYPQRPILAVSAAIIRDNRVLIVRRAKPPSEGFYTLPGGGVEAGESLHDAITREVMEETGIAIEPVAFAGYREAVRRDADGKVARHFVIMAFACRWLAGEPRLNEELAEARWLEPAEIAGLKTTDGLTEIVAAAFEKAGA
ncbi:MAG: NUDIX hydrolase [Pseudorhodoplanes sp.]|nr:NUDIX hydrolase [Pseudorhodoplanes sp.]